MLLAGSHQGHDVVMVMRETKPPWQLEVSSAQ